MRTSLLRRLEKLETLTKSEALPFVLYGWVKPLPKEFTGERHVVILKRTPTGSPRISWCSFEERAGPAPAKDSGDESGVINRSGLACPD
jgi:hypothetical protein